MVDRKPDTTEPTLTDMTAAAIARLRGDKDGYYLMVEGGRIDHAHHAGQAGFALEEAVEFARAVQWAVENTDSAETLIMVTADHSHTLTISGYPKRGNDILGLVVPPRGNGEDGGDGTSPLLAAKDLGEALDAFERHGYDTMLSAVRVKRFFWNDDATPVNYDPSARPRRQEFAGTLMENGAFYITNRAILATHACRLGGRIGIHEMSETSAVEIDEPEDWALLSRLLERARVAQE